MLAAPMMTWFTPSALGVILFTPCLILAILLPWLFSIVFRALGVDTRGAIPATVWGRELIVAYLVAMLMGRALTIATRPRWRDVLLALAVTAGAALLAAALVSKQYWGYYFSRPPLDARVVKTREVRAVTLVETLETGGQATFVARRDLSLEKAIQVGRRNPYDHPRYRALVALSDRQLLPEAPAPVRAATLTAAHAWLEATGLLVPGEAGYPHAKRLDGVVLELEDERGEALTFLGVGSEQVSNDHYAYYEVVFSAPSGAGDPRALSATRFFYDIAGIEGVEWWIVWIVFAGLGNGITVPATVAVLARRRR
jgi:hypothetical protein